MERADQLQGLDARGRTMSESRRDQQPQGPIPAPEPRRRGRLAQRRGADHDRAAARQGRDPRLLDLRLRQLHARAARSQDARAALSRRARGHRRALAEVHQREGHREPEADPGSLRDRAPGGQRRQPAKSGGATARRPGRRASSSIRPATSSAPRWARATSKASSARSARWCACSTSAARSNRSPLPLAARTPAPRRSAAAVSRQGARRRAERSPVHRRLEPQPHRRRDARRQADRGDRLRPAGRQRRHLSRRRASIARRASRSMATQLYVADTENHQIRVVDFQARAVHTVAGTGKQGAWGGEGGDALRIDLNSPWDLALKPGILIVAMAGSHQIWVIDLLHDQAYPYAGTGEEARRDGAVNEAAFAQPSGLAVDGNTLYVADAESNTIRAVELPPGEHRDHDRRRRSVRVRRRGRHGDDVRLQHPLGVAAARRARVHRRHLQPQDQDARSRAIRQGLDVCRPASTSLADCRSPATRCTSPTPTITRSGRSISSRARSRRWRLRV